ncbi:uncharacterized protein LOC135162749 [Diachasmimorpha longicaudata]|uniref:uncharacterized protein LOC135162749 n=1 Tax=Diachasmimorpha longicaudata TaxID=58733 RepID=UPI0030B8924E
MSTYQDGTNLHHNNREASLRGSSPAVANKKNQKSRFLTDIGSLCCEPETISLEPPVLWDGYHHTSDVLLQVNAPHHVGLDLSVHPYNDCFLDQRKPVAEQSSKKLPWTPITIPADSNIGSIFKDFEFLNWNHEYDPPARLQTWTERLFSTHENLWNR